MIAHAAFHHSLDAAPADRETEAEPDRVCARAAEGPANDFTKFGKAWAVPLGVNAVVTINPTIAVGAAFTFGKLVGAPALSDATPSQTGEDFRAIHVWLNYTQL